MKEQFARTSLLVGTEALGKLNSSRVCVFGVGGVGGYAGEVIKNILDLKADDND